MTIKTAGGLLTASARGEEGILGDPGADKGGEGKSKRAEKIYTERRKVKNGEKSPWGQCLTRPVPNGRPHFPARLDFPSSPVSAPGSPRMGRGWLRSRSRAPRLLASLTRWKKAARANSKIPANTKKQHKK